MLIPASFASVRTFVAPAVFCLCAIASSHATAAPATDVDRVFDSSFEAGETPPIEGVCDSFYPADFQLLEGQLNPAVPALAKPAKGVVVREPSFSTCLVRATHHDAEPPVGFARNDYSRRQSFNADNTLMLVYAYDGGWHVYNANTLQWVKKLNGVGGDAEPQWDETDANLLYFVPNNGGTELRKMHVDTNTWEVAVDFSGRLPSWANAAEHIWTKSEGSPSRDNRFWGFQVEDANFNILGVIVWDLQLDRLVGSRPLSVRPDHVSMTPSGRWVITSSGSPDGEWAWSPDFSQKKRLHHTSEHSDVAVAPNGHDYFVSIDYESSRGDVFYTDIDACPAVPASQADAPVCPRTVLFPLYQNGSAAALHISGRAFNRPGWVLMGTYATSPSRDGSWPWYTDKLFAIELTATPRVYGLAYHRVDYNGYWTEPQGSVNRDFTRIVYNSNWGVSTTLDVDDYLIQLPANAIPTSAP